jgi:hypothetical protein
MALNLKSENSDTCSSGKSKTAKGSCGCAGVSKPAASSAETTAPPTEGGAEKRTFVPGKDRRESRVDRRSGMERRQLTAEASGYEGEERRSGSERRVATGLERRRGPGRRRADDRREAEEGEMNVEQFEFIMAIETYKKVNKRLYPTWTEILEIVRQLGYRKIQTRDIQLDNVPEPTLSKVA